MPESTAEGSPFERENYYLGLIEGFLDSYKDRLNFTEFVREKEAINLGDGLLSSRLSTGYNFATADQFPLNSSESLIFYGVYAQRKLHLAKVLAKMEKDKIISEENVSFGIMGTKILGNYGDEEPVVRNIRMKDGKVEPTMESVEMLLVFGLDRDVNKEDRKIQAARIGAFLVAEAPSILGGYEDPNTRATATDELRNALVSVRKGKFREALSNAFFYNSGNLIALKQEKPISGAQLKNPTFINRKLYKYLAKFGVGR